MRQKYVGGECQGLRKEDDYETCHVGNYQRMSLACNTQESLVVQRKQFRANPSNHIIDVSILCRYHIV